MGEWRPADGMAIDPAVLAALGSGADASTPEPSPGRSKRSDAGEGRKTTRTPHEKGRAGRSVNVSFPDGAWVDAVKDLAVRWRCRPADVFVLAVSRLMDDVRTGDLRRPGGKIEFYMRAGGEWDLPWEPD